ncbi:MAG: glutathione S-transferase N-terminal domain-containing protein, partial [Primorskyibacter sp.]
MIRLHHCPQTRSMRSLWLLHELGIPFEVVTHGFDKTLRDPAYLALSPAGRV